MCDDFVRGTNLHDPSQVDDRDAVGDNPREREVVRDEQVGKVAALAEVQHQP